MGVESLEVFDANGTKAFYGQKLSQIVPYLLMDTTKATVGGEPLVAKPLSDSYPLDLSGSVGYSDGW